MPIPPGLTVTVSARPDKHAFRPATLCLSTPEAWRVRDIRIGGRKIGYKSLFVKYGWLSGTALKDPSIGDFVTFDTVYSDMDIIMDVEYIGADPKGAVLYATCIGHRVELSDTTSPQGGTRASTATAVS